MGGNFSCDTAVFIGRRKYEVFARMEVEILYGFDFVGFELGCLVSCIILGCV